MSYYTQNNEEEVILKYFGEHKGTFLSLGENDGETFSNVRALSLLGWCGVMVEPSPLAHHRLKALYSDNKKGCFYVYNCAIGLVNGPIDFWESGELIKTGDTSLVSTAVPAETKRFASAVSYTAIKVDCFRWKTFQNRLSIKEFDFISIDIEGLDLEVLKQIDVSSTKMVCIEHNGSKALGDQYAEYLQGFNVVYESAENLIFAR